LIHSPNYLLSQKQSIVDELGEAGLVVFDLPREQLPPRSVQHMSPVKLLASVYTPQALFIARPPPFLAYPSLPSENPADSSLLVATL
jgi:hypothetical protein